jgi:hypothetical protein
MGTLNHDAYKIIQSQTIAVATSGGASAQSSAFGAQTLWVRLAFSSSTTGSGVRYNFGSNPAATSTSSLLPANWVEVVKINPGSKLACLSNDASTQSLNISELTD